jgi:hypothetical protein
VKKLGCKSNKKAQCHFFCNLSSSFVEDEGYHSFISNIKIIAGKFVKRGDINGIGGKEVYFWKQWTGKEKSGSLLSGITGSDSNHGSKTDDEGRQ